MMHWYTIILSVDVLFFTYAAVMLYRNQKVFGLRTRMSDRLFSYPDWQWRLVEYKRVSYRQMVYRFWLWPIEAPSFYADVSFLEAPTQPVPSPFYQKV